MRSKTPEQEELEFKLAELQELEQELIQSEFELVTLSNQLEMFQHDFNLRVGESMASFESLQADLASLIATHSPTNPEAQSRAESSARQAEESARNTAQQAPANHVSDPPTDEIKQLFRDLTKQLHPDLTLDDLERQRRTVLMAQVNEMYKDQDEEGLKRMLEQEAANPAAVKGHDIAAQLIRAIRSISSVKKRLVALEQEIINLKKTDLHSLYETAQDHLENGEDLLASIKLKFKRQIRKTLHRLSVILEKSYE